jgi:hypothetical protein
MLLPLSTDEILSILREDRYQGPVDERGMTRLQYLNEAGDVVFESEQFWHGQLITPRLRDIVTNFAEALIQH